MRAQRTCSPCLRGVARSSIVAMSFLPEEDITDGSIGEGEWRRRGEGSLGVPLLGPHPTTHARRRVVQLRCAAGMGPIRAPSQWGSLVASTHAPRNV